MAKDVYDPVWLTHHLGVVTDEQVMNVKRNAMLALDGKVELRINLDETTVECVGLELEGEIPADRVNYVKEVVKYFLGPEWVCNVIRKSNPNERPGKANKRTAGRRKKSVRKVVRRGRG